MVTAGIDTGCLVDNVILGLAEPFQRNNREQLTKLAHDSGSADALTAVLSYIRQYSRLNPEPDSEGNRSALPVSQCSKAQKHACIYKGAKECAMCKAFYAHFK